MKEICETCNTTRRTDKCIEAKRMTRTSQTLSWPHAWNRLGSGQSDTDEAMATAALLRNKPSPGSTTLEDVLDSLLGLPSASRTPSPGPGPVVTGTSTTIRHRTNVGQANAKAGKSCSDLRQDLQGRRTIENMASKAQGGGIVISRLPWIQTSRCEAYRSETNLSVLKTSQCVGPGELITFMTTTSKNAEDASL